MAKKQFEELLHQEADLSRRLGHLEYRPPEAGRSVELNDVRAAIPSDAMLFEFARVEAEDWNDQGGPNGAKPVQRYGVWIIPPEGQGDVQVVDLGEAKQIDSEIEKVRAIFGKFDLQVDSEEERELEQQYRETVGTLTDLVLRPLETRGARARRWILSPDGQLWLIPWAALPTTDGASLVENRIISYVISGRDLLSREHPPQKLAPPVIMADPITICLPPTPQPAPRKLIAELQKDLGPSDLLLNRSGTGDGSEPIKRSAPANKALRLPLTRNEAKAIFPYLQIYAKAEPLLFLDNDALKGVFKSIRHPHAVVLSTHGEFATAQDMGVDESHLKPGAGFLLENPLLRCHLLLAGCNQRSPPSEDVDDGVLTGAEIVGCDLRGTDLVVLSACKTGLGDIHAGLSAAGLRQAFQLAGAQTVVASLWSVPDVETATLMEAFFKNLAGGASKAAALCEAQRDLIKARRAARRGAAHPYFWAAFTLTGPP